MHGGLASFRLQKAEQFELGFAEQLSEKKLPGVSRWGEVHVILFSSQ